MPKTLTNRKPSRRYTSGDIRLRLLPEEREAALQRAKAKGLSRNAYIASLVRRDLKKAA